MPSAWDDPNNPLNWILGIPGTIFERGQAAASPHAQGVGGVLNAISNPQPYLQQDRLDRLRQQHPEVFTAIDYDLANGNGQGAFQAVTQFETAMRAKGDTADADALIPIIHATRQRALAGNAPMTDVARMATYEDPSLKNILGAGKGIAEQGLLGAQAGKERAHQGTYEQQGNYYGQQANTVQQMRPYQIKSEVAQANQRNAAAGASSAHAGLFNAQTGTEKMKQEGKFPYPVTGRGTGPKGTGGQAGAIKWSDYVGLGKAIATAAQKQAEAAALGMDDEAAAMGNDVQNLRANRDYLNERLRSVGVDPAKFESGQLGEWIGPNGETGVAMSELGDQQSGDYIPAPGAPNFARQGAPTSMPATPTVTPPVMPGNRGPQTMTTSARYAQLIQAGMSDSEARMQVRREIQRALPPDQAQALENPAAGPPQAPTPNYSYPVEGIVPGVGSASMDYSSKGPVSSPPFTGMGFAPKGPPLFKSGKGRPLRRQPRL